MTKAPNVFAIPAGTPQLETFVTAYLSGALFGRGPLSPLEIADSRIFVPTRRAGIALTAALATAAGGEALLLPQILPLGDTDALDEVLDSAPPLEGEIPSEIGALDRQLLLFDLVEAWRKFVATQRGEEEAQEAFHVGASKADAFALASDLARLMDETIIEDVPLSRLATGVPEDYRPERHSAYWARTEEFLQIAAQYYPEALRARGLTDKADGTIRRLRAFARRLADQATPAPTVVFGSTGSVAATAELMGVVTRLPMGAVVLPGLDRTGLAREYWPLIGAETADLPTRYAHPQGLLKRTLNRIGIEHDAVRRLPEGSVPLPRERLLSEIFVPAVTTDRWHASEVTGDLLAQALDGITLIEASDEREEALAIALLLRQVLETPGQTAALVTPDRALARAVQMELRRWNVVVADSAGEPLNLAPAATLARLALRAADPGCTALDLLALLRHPLARLGQEEDTRRSAVDAIEIAALRGKRLKGGGLALPAAVARAMAEKLTRHAPAPRQRVQPQALEAGLALAQHLASVLARFHGAITAAPHMRGWAAAHCAMLEALLSPAPDAPGVLAGDDGNALVGLFEAVAASADDGPAFTAGDYAAIFDQLMAGIVVRPHQPGHPRLKIWGLLEARLLDADRMILAGLDEGIWPPEVRGDPFLNRPMRIALGLQPPERRIGQTAHDFLMLLGAPDVVLTRAAKRGGAPTIASRFLRRLTAFAGEDAHKILAGRGAPVLGWARALDVPAMVQPAPQPEPHPPAALTPKRISITDVETLYRDPYAIFARRILGLDRLDAIDPPLEARERGTVIHEALARFTQRHGKALPDGAEAELLAFGQAAFAEVQQEDPEIAQFWVRRFEAFVPNFIEWDRKRREELAEIHVEVGGSVDLALPGGVITTLSGRADRVEILRDGSLAVVDYKTGGAPSSKEVLSGHAPQLSLTAAMVARGGFPDVGRRDGERGIALSYLRIAAPRGALKETPVKPDKQTMQQVIEQQFAQLHSYLGQHVTGALGYRSHRLPKKKQFVGDYDHLARHLEWSLGSGDETEGGE